MTIIDTPVENKTFDGKLLFFLRKTNKTPKRRRVLT